MNKKWAWQSIKENGVPSELHPSGKASVLFVLIGENLMYAGFYDSDGDYWGDWAYDVTWLSKDVDYWMYAPDYPGEDLPWFFEPESEETNER